MVLVIVAIDGPAGSGKSTVAKQVARDLNFFFLNSGACYRAVALSLLRQHQLSLFSEDAHDADAIIELCNTTSDEDLVALADAIQPQIIGGELYFFAKPVDKDLYAERVGEVASRLSASIPLRHRINELLRILVTDVDVVVEGRDTGTDMFPHAEVKIFLTASLEERAKRRGAQDAGEVFDAELAARMKERDERDTHRAVGALRQAEDAYLIDSTGLTARQVCEKIVSYIRLKKVM